MKKKLITILISAAIVACLAGFASCGKLSAPDQAHKNGNVVRINYDTNGGIIGGGDNVTLFDMFNPYKYTADANGNVHIKVLDPVDERRENIGKSESNKNPLTKPGNILVGWYKTRTENADGSYSYSDKWNFETDSFEVKQDTAGEEFTLYALWTEFFEFDYYRVKPDGNIEFIRKDQLGVIPSEVKGTAKAYQAGIYLPDWVDGAMNYETNEYAYTFPKIEGTTFSAAYLDRECKEKITVGNGEPYIHTGYVDEHGNAQNRVCNVYIAYDNGEKYKIETAKQFVKYASVDGDYEIANDLDFTEVQWPKSLTTGTFTGKIYGKDGKKIKFSNISAKITISGDYAGLFGRIAENAVIDKIDFDNVTVDFVSGGIDAKSLIGSFAGYIDEKAKLEDVNLTNFEMKIGAITKKSANIDGYKVNLIANGNVDDLAFVSDNVGLTIHCDEETYKILEAIRYKIKPDNLLIENGNLVLAFTTSGEEESYSETYYVIQERR